MIFETGHVLHNADDMFSASFIESSSGPSVFTVDLKLDWSANYLGNKSEFKMGYRKQIIEYWDKRFKLKIIDKQKNVIAECVPELQLTDATGDPSANYRMGIQNTRWKPSSVDTKKHSCCLAPDDIKKQQDTLKMKIGLKRSHVKNSSWGYSRTVFKAAVTELGNKLPQQFSLTKSNVSTGVDKLDSNNIDARDNLFQLFSSLKRKQLPFLMRVEYPAGQKFEIQKSFFDFLINKPGFSKEFFDCLLDNGLEVPGRSDIAVVPHTDDTAMHDFKSEHNYPIAAHEFGHMLGLFDEYFPISDPQNHGADSWVNRLSLFDVEAPVFDCNSLSLMAMGDRILPCHYEPFAMALKSMITSEYNTVGQRYMSDKSNNNLKQRVDFLSDLRVHISEK